MQMLIDKEHTLILQSLLSPQGKQLLFQFQDAIKTRMSNILQNQQGLTIVDDQIVEYNKIEKE